MAGIDCAGRWLDLSTPRVMGVLNVTPDSFSDGGRWFSTEAAVIQAHQLVEAGAAVVDIGGESTRPGALPVSESEELARVIPVIEALGRAFPVPLSIDTSKPGVMKAAVAAGASLINDVLALRQPGALEAAASCEVPVCLMHLLGEPRTMQQRPLYHEVVTEVRDFLMARVAACEAAGIPRTRLLIDPGIGFGKTPNHNLTLLRRLGELNALGLPLMVGVSRKSLIGVVTGRPITERLAGSLALAVLAAQRGACLLRVHDVAETVDALALVRAVSEGLPEQ
ncbi:dihydropteroate synthase [Gammaproteobacteria bacterium]